MKKFVQKRAEEFIIVWQNSKSVKTVSEKLKLAESTVKVQASLFRRMGVQLKKFNRSESRNWPKLRKLAERELKKQGLKNNYAYTVRTKAR